MEIKVDTEEMQAAIDKGATSAIKSAFEGYSMRSAMEKVVTDSVLPTVIGSAISGAIDKFDIESLQKAVAEQMARSITSGVQLMFRETTIDMLLMLRKVPDYDKDRREKERAKIIAEMDGTL